MKQGNADRPSHAATGPRSQQSVLSVVSTWVGAALAMVVLLGLGTWFYQLGVRDAQSVPVIRASTEPVKIRPADAGGEVTPHQEIASYNAGSGEDVVEPEPQLAESAPEPAEEDQPVAVAPQPVETAPEPVASPEPEVVEPEVAEPAAPETSPLPQAEPEQQATVATVVPTAPEAAPEAEAAPEPIPPAGESSPLAPAFSPEIRSRPANLRDRMVAAREAAEVDQDKLAERALASRVKIQLRASPSRDEVVAAWRRIQAANRDVLGAKALALQTTNSGGTTFYRLRVGPFRDRAEANAVCQALRARGQDCIVTTSG